MRIEKLIDKLSDLENFNETIRGKVVLDRIGVSGLEELIMAHRSGKYKIPAAIKEHFPIISNYDTIAEIIIDKIRYNYYEYNREPSLIVVHPTMIKWLVKDNPLPFIDRKNFKFLGIKVITSEDIDYIEIF